MTRTTRFFSTVLGLFVLLGLLVGSLPAVVTSDTPGSHVVTSGMSAFGIATDGVVIVGGLRDSGEPVGICSGALISDRHVLTAAHCFDEDGDGEVDPWISWFPHEAIFELAEGYAAIQHGVDSIRFPDTGLTPRGDLAVVTLDVEAPEGVPRYPLYGGNDEVGRPFVLVAYGAAGHGATGQDTSGDAQPTKRAGLNRYDAIRDDLPEGDFLAYDFDSGQPENNSMEISGFESDLGFGPDEVFSATGDGGGPSFINGAIAAVTTFGERLPAADVNDRLDSSWGEVGFDVRVSVFREFILETTGGAAVFVTTAVLGDINTDGELNGLDVAPFVNVLLNGTDDNATRITADMNSDGEVNGLDVDPFVAGVVGGGTQQIPEPSTLLLGLVALGLVGGWRQANVASLRGSGLLRSGNVMRWLATLAVVAVSALMSPTTATGQYTLGDWASDHGYTPGDAMPIAVDASSSSPAIDSLSGINEFDWTTTPTTAPLLSGNEISSIEAGDFSGLPNLTNLELHENQIASIESGDFSGLTDLTMLNLHSNQISSIEPSVFSELTNLATLNLHANRLSSIEPVDFAGLTNLSRLSFSWNQLSSLESGAFSGLTNLDRLYLDGNQISNIESGAFSGLTNLTWLNLGGNQLSSIESGDFTGLDSLTGLGLGLHSNQLSSIEAGTFSELPNLRLLGLQDNQLSSLESGAFGGLPNLFMLYLRDNTALTELNLADADFSSLVFFNLNNNVNITSVSLKNSVLNQTSLEMLLDGDGGFSGTGYTGIGELDGITELDLSGIDFAGITGLEELYVMDDLTDLWLAGTAHLDATGLDVLLDNLTTIEGTSTEGILHMTQVDFDNYNTAGGGLLAAWDAEPGHHIAFVSEPLPGDLNLDGAVNGLDVDLFVDVLLAGRSHVAADMNGDGAVNGLDVDPFVAAVVGGTQPIPEPSTLLLCLIALAVVGGWRTWGG